MLNSPLLSVVLISGKIILLPSLILDFIHLVIPLIAQARFTSAGPAGALEAISETKTEKTVK
jgi:hypothetical protein